MCIIEHKSIVVLKAKSRMSIFSKLFGGKDKLKFFFNILVKHLKFLSNTYFLYKNNFTLFRDKRFCLGIKIVLKETNIKS